MINKFILILSYFSLCQKNFQTFKKKMHLSKLTVAGMAQFSSSPPWYPDFDFIVVPHTNHHLRISGTEGDAADHVLVRVPGEAAAQPPVPDVRGTVLSPGGYEAITRIDQYK